LKEITLYYTCFFVVVANEVSIYWTIRDGVQFYTPPGNSQYYVSPVSGNLYFSNLNGEYAHEYLCEIRSSWADSSGNTFIKTWSSPSQLIVSGIGKRY